MRIAVTEQEAWFPRLVGPLVIAGAFVALASWSWRKWPDVQIDFASQLYIPWQLASGKALYLDLDYKDGPFSQYLNALLFRLFGVSLRTLIWANLAGLAALCALVYRLFADTCGRFTATCVVLVELGVFSFSQYTGIGNYNYVCPYTHEQTHGIVLAAGMIAALAAVARSGGFRPAALVGLALGALFLTKAELFVPAAAAAGLGMCLLTWTPGGRGRGRALWLTIGVAALVPVLGMLGFLYLRMPWALAFKGVAGNWFHLRGDILEYRFYRVGVGFDDPVGNLVWSIELLLGIALAVTGAILATWCLRRVHRWRALWATAAGLAVLVGLLAAPDVVPWRQMGRPLPWTSATACLVLLGAVVRRRHDPPAVARLLPLALWSLLALGLLGKVLLNVRISHYGFVLAMPATLLLVATLVHGVPRLLERRLGTGTLARALLLAPVIAGVVFFLRWSDALYARKTLPVGDGGDMILAGDPEVDPRPAMLALAADRLRARMPVGATLLTAPEGLMLNYWLRRPNPTRHVYFVPWSIAYAGGEAAIVRDLTSHPPDFVVLTHREADEYGFGYFGSPGYGREIMDWVRARYRRVDRIGAEPFTDGRFGILILASSGATEGRRPQE